MPGLRRIDHADDRAEQYFLELLNRARMDPGAEAARQRVGLNEACPAAPLARLPTGHRKFWRRRPQLDRAAENHSSWMARTGTFSHEGSGGSSDISRVQAAELCAGP